VGGRDYVISKIFDKDGDGKLNAEERKNADEAVRNVSISSYCCLILLGNRKEFLLERGAVRCTKAIQNTPKKGRIYRRRGLFACHRNISTTSHFKRCS